MHRLQFVFLSRTAPLRLRPSPFNNNNNNNNNNNDDDDDNDNNSNDKDNRIERRKSRFLQSPHCAANGLSTHAQVARAQSCANHVQHHERVSRAACVPRGAKGQLSYQV